MSASSSVQAATPAAQEQNRRTGAAAQKELTKARRLRRRDVALAILTPVLLLVAWQLAAEAGLIDRQLFPPPSETLTRGVEMLAGEELLTHIGATVARLATGYTLGALLGIVCGLAMGTWRPLNAALGPTFSALYALPKIAILPLLLLIFGLTETPKILAVMITIFFVLQINTLSGIRQIDSRVLEAAQAYGATGWRQFRFVIIPAVLPSIFTGLRVAAGLGVIVITAVEFVASNNGLGFLIWNSWQLFQPERMYVGLIAVSILGALLTFGITFAEYLAIPWRRANKPSRSSRRRNEKRSL
jgi:NitT/TauT family transport system permease protein